MQLISFSSVALAALLHVASADFAIYRQGVGGNGITGNTWGWMAYNGPPDCNTVTEWIWRDSSDVSGGKYGVRCEGDGCPSDSDPAGITTLEMNFNSDSKHFTFYQELGNGLFDLSNNQIGTCEPLYADNFYCGKTAGSRSEGVAALTCQTFVAGSDLMQQPA
ncbi:hypothetical protein GGR57DRAFT_198807 [Xylariaceae sp. FL1272]|nr:hypothetical protein GGR57DRAFT_198807 [Xylariaceae sp. FL1272]